LHKELPSWVVFILLVALIVAMAVMGIYWATASRRQARVEGPKPVLQGQNKEIEKAGAQPATKPDDLALFVNNFRQTHLSHDGEYLRVTNEGDGPDMYGLKDETDMSGYSSGRVTVSHFQTWIDLAEHALPADKMVNAIWDGNSFVAYQTLDGAFLYHLDSKKTEELKVDKSFKIGWGGCRPSFNEFSPSRRFLIIRSLGETEYCGVFGLYDLKKQAMIDMPGVYNGLTDQAYAFEPTPQNGGEFRVFYLDDWWPKEIKEGDLPYYEPHEISVLNTDNGKTKVVYQDNLSNIVGLRYEYPYLVLVPEGRGVKEIKIKINEQTLP